MALYPRPGTKSLLHFVCWKGLTSCFGLPFSDTQSDWSGGVPEGRRLSASCSGSAVIRLSTAQVQISATMEYLGFRIRVMT